MQNRMTRKYIVLDWKHQNDSRSMRTNRRGMSLAHGVRNEEQSICTALDDGGLTRCIDAEVESAGENDVVPSAENKGIREILEGV